ncbi:helix-turn-helix transcriptional regulator [Bacillus sp. JJ864]|uniref:helix-turn-helix domain-containing protein n=1 Tax=Bacillus sp. JJ864 TaxID=3122975 RepID=UPI002FFF036A
MKAEVIKYIRKALELTQEQFADLINVSLLTVSRYENGVQKPSDDTEKRMRAVLNLSDTEIAEIEQFMLDEKQRKLKDMIRTRVGL